MRFLRGLYLIVTGLALAGLLAALLVFPELVIQTAGSVSEISLILRLLIAVVVVVGLLGLVYLQVKPTRRSENDGLQVRVSGASTEVSLESAKERILKAVREVRDVRSAEAKLTSVRGRADVELMVSTFPEINVPEKQKEINRALKQVINKQLGLQMAGRPRIHIQLIEDSGISSMQPVKSPVVETALEVSKLTPAKPVAAMTSLAPSTNSTVVGPSPQAETLFPGTLVEEDKPRAGLLGGFFRQSEPSPELKSPDVNPVTPAVITKPEMLDVTSIPAPEDNEASPLLDEFLSQPGNVLRSEDDTKKD